MSQKRIPLLSLAAALFVVVLFVTPGTGLEAHARPSSGQVEAVPLASFGSSFERFLKDWSVPGASLAIARKGRMVFAKGYGWSDREHNVRAAPDTLYRIASISKAITAVAALKLCQQQRLSLDDKAFSILDDLQPCTGAVQDPRIYQISVRDLLHCTAGWDPKRSGDPLFVPHCIDAATECGTTPPADLKTTIRYWIKRRLDFEPGTSWGYSNLAYAILGELISRKSGQSYQDYVAKEILAPMGITDMNIGKTLASERFPKEAVYYSCPGQPSVESIFPGKKAKVSWQYGGDFSMDTIAAAAGWIASVEDMVKFSSCLSNDGGLISPLSTEQFALMLSRPQCKYWQGKKGYFAMGWEVYPVTSGSGYTFSRVGTISGAMAFLVHRYDGTSWAVAFNSRPADADRFMSEAKKLIWIAINEQKVWPAGRQISQNQ